MTTNTTTTIPEPDTGELRRELPPPPGKNQGKPKKRGFIWFFFLIIVVGITVYAVWRASKPGLIPQTNQGGGGRGGRGGRGGFGGAIPVVVAKVRSGPVPVYLEGLGNVSAFYTVTVKSRVDGQLMKVNFEEGDFVKEGQTLIEIDPRPYQVQLEQAEGTLARDIALLENAKLDLTRYDTLVKQQAVPSQQLDTQKALVAQYEGTITQDHANVDNAKLQLVYAHITAPITGVIGLRLVDPGNIVHAADANGMIVITQLQPISVLFTIPEDDLPSVIPKLRAGMHLTVDAYNRDNSKKIASGTLLTMDNQIDNTTGTSKLKATFDNKDYALFPQQFVNIKLLVDTLQNQIIVPAVAVQSGQQGSFVYVIDDHNMAHMRPVQLLGAPGQEGANIKSGLSVGEQVAVDGADRLQDGVVVRVRQAGEVEREAAADAAAMAAKGRGRGGRGGRGANGGTPGAGNGAPSQAQPGDGSGTQGSPAGAGGPEGHGHGFGGPQGGHNGQGPRGDGKGFGGRKGGPGGQGRDGKGYKQQ